MKKIFLLLFFFLLTLNCAKNKVSNTHGVRFIEKKFEILELNKSNKNDVRKFIGPPSTVSEFDNKWVYIERQKRSQSLLKLGERKINMNNVLIIEFNESGILISKNLLNINDMNKIIASDKKTQKKFSNNNLVYDIFSTLREKINAGTRKKKNGGP